MLETRYSSLFVDATEPEKAESVPPPSPYRLLLVDDDPGILAALKRVFHRENYQLFFADSAAKALTLLETTPVELIVSDFMMPGMNGSELLRHVRERWPETLRIMLTGYANTEAVMGSMQEGAVYRFNLKPWDDDDLRLTVAMALEQYELRRRNRILTQAHHAQATDLTPLNQLDVGKRSRLAMLLYKKGLLNARQIQHLHKEMQAHKTPVIRHLLQHDWIDPQGIYALLRDERLCEEVDLGEFQIDPSLLAIVPQAVCMRQWVIPLRVMGQRLDLAMADPLDTGLVEVLSFISGYHVRPLLCSADQMQAKLSEAFGMIDDCSEGHALPADDSDTCEDPYEGIEVILDDDGDAESLDQLLGRSADPPAIRLVNAIILEALRLGASAIHIHPRIKHVMVRYRIDGVLQDKIQIPSTLLVAVVSRIKMMAELDIAERRHPQDGLITVKTPMRIVDLRIATLPTVHGEKVTMHVLERQAAVRPLHALGLSAHNLQRLQHAGSRPRGVILAAGPADSGRIAMLYALLQHGDAENKNLVTLDDPVGFHVDLASQIAVHKPGGAGLVDMLQAALHQDTDSILIGEIANRQVAEAAFGAAAAGHLIFSTLPDHSIASAIAHLFALGVTSYELASGLEAIVVLRLARRLCLHCREAISLPIEQMQRLGASFCDPALPVYRGRGCQYCHQGYKGQIGLHEVLLMDDVIRDAIVQGASPWKLEILARERGMTTLLDDARDKLHQGLTSAEEILRLFGSQYPSEPQ